MNIVFKVSDNIKEKMIDYYKDLKKEKTPPYTVFQAQEEDTIITMYESGKVMFQGMSADIDANMWKDQERHLNNRNIDEELKEKDKKEEIDKSYYYFDAIGSDEVGTGDYFGPIVVAATFVTKQTRKLLEDLKIDDSKKMNDDKIRRCAPIIMNKIPYEIKIMNNIEFNNLTRKNYNMNKIKALMHNEVLYKLSNRETNYHKIIVDQFAKPINYFSYLKQENVQEKVTKITFLTKAESKHLSVAAASVICRYIFLEELDKISEKYNIKLQKGAGELVDKQGKELVSKYGEQILHEISKINFKNTEKILNN